MLISSVNLQTTKCYIKHACMYYECFCLREKIDVTFIYLHQVLQVQDQCIGLILDQLILSLLTTAGSSGKKGTIGIVK